MTQHSTITGCLMLNRFLVTKAKTDKALSCRAGTARRSVLVEMLTIAAKIASKRLDCTVS